MCGTSNNCQWLLLSNVSHSVRHGVIDEASFDGIMRDTVADIYNRSVNRVHTHPAKPGRYCNLIIRIPGLFLALQPATPISQVTCLVKSASDYINVYDGVGQLADYRRSRRYTGSYKYVHILVSLRNTSLKILVARTCFRPFPPACKTKL